MVTGLRRRRAFACLALPLFAAAALTACGDGDDGVTLTPAPAPLACSATALAAVAPGGTTVASAQTVTGGSYTPAGSNTPITGLPASFCVVKGTASPTTDSLINFELWVPDGAAWNGKLVTTGNGGYSPALSFSDMAYAMRQGYAALGGDTGHQSADPNEMFWGVGHPEKIIDWGTRSVHAITVPGKALVAALAGRAASHSYYIGCSTGGHQGYAEVQRYPADFDGVIAGAPGNNRTKLNVEFLWRFQSNRAQNTNTPVVLTSAKAALLTSSAVAACDALDGVTDGVMEDPRACTTAQFNVDSLLCPGADAPTCLTQAQIDVAKRIYQGPVNPRTSQLIYPGPVVGTESGWPQYWGGTEPVRADFWRLWTYDNPGWNWWTFDYDRDVTFALAKVGFMVDHVDTDIAAFKARGGKLITFHGWSDAVVSALDTIAYYDAVKARQGSQAATDSFFRLFMVPGMGHCSGGTGATRFGNGGQAPPIVDANHDVLSALDRWVVNGVAPERIVASRVVNNATVRTRPLCPYPKKAIWSGTGSTDDAANFACQ